MITLYAAHTPNGWRGAIALAESGLAYRVHPVDFAAKPPELLRANPLGAIPVMVEGDRILTQSTAILLDVARRTGRFRADDPVALEWMMFAASDCAFASGTIYSLAHDFGAPEHVPQAEAHLRGLFGHADRRLTNRAYLADALSVADLALYPLYHWRRGLTDGLLNLQRWAETLEARPAIRRGIALA